MEPLLTDFTRDLISITSLVVTVIGFPLTVVSLLYAIRQIREAKSAAMAAQEAANRTLKESEFRFVRFAAGNASRFLSETRVHLDNRHWRVASLRAGDLGDLLSQLARDGSGFEGLVTELRVWQANLIRVETGDIKFADKKWQSFQVRLQRIVDNFHSPFADRSPEVTR